MHFVHFTLFIMYCAFVHCALYIMMEIYILKKGTVKEVYCYITTHYVTVGQHQKKKLL